MEAGSLLGFCASLEKTNHSSLTGLGGGFRENLISFRRINNGKRPLIKGALGSWSS